MSAWSIPQPSCILQTDLSSLVGISPPPQRVPLPTEQRFVTALRCLPFCAAGVILAQQSVYRAHTHWWFLQEDALWCSVPPPSRPSDSENFWMKQSVRALYFTALKARRYPHFALRYALRAVACEQGVLLLTLWTGQVYAFPWRTAPPDVQWAQSLLLPWEPMPATMRFPLPLAEEGILALQWDAQFRPASLPANELLLLRDAATGATPSVQDPTAPKEVLLLRTTAQKDASEGVWLSP